MTTDPNGVSLGEVWRRVVGMDVKIDALGEKVERLEIRAAVNGVRTSILWAIAGVAGAALLSSLVAGVTAVLHG